MGGCVVLTDRFDPEQTLALIERQRITFGHFVPTMFTRLLKLPPAVRAKYDHSSLRKVVHGAAPCPIEVKRAMLEWWGPIIYEYYAGTEGVGSTKITPQEWLERPGSVGRAVATFDRDVDPARHDPGIVGRTPPGEAAGGEPVSRGPPRPRDGGAARGCAGRARAL